MCSHGVETPIPTQPRFAAGRYHADLPTLRAIRATFGRVPSAARWVFMEPGLLLFMAGVGPRAGSGLLDTLAASRPSLFLAGLLVTSDPVAGSVILLL
jgi:uncharacterized transporter YbjL